MSALPGRRGARSHAGDLADGSRGPLILDLHEEGYVGVDDILRVRSRLGGSPAELGDQAQAGVEGGFLSTSSLDPFRRR